ncbi:MAG: TetR/AcrR family transcriptional regulator [Rhodobacteraceae bacterium]|nr:TetR/AcrR family transcriptional regulator [Paracoccaceae bacterium]
MSDRKARTRAQTRARIIAEALALLRAGGMGAVTFDAIAARLGVSKQAVIYWFPNKAQLLGAVALGCLRDEAEAAIAAARAASGPAQARRDVVQALIRFHLDDLPRFRLMYAAPQIGARPAWAPEILDRVHEITAQQYGSVAAALGEGEEARRAAVVLHMAALGHVLLVGLTEAVGDPMRHSPQALADTLAAMVGPGA